MFTLLNQGLLIQLEHGIEEPEVEEYFEGLFLHRAKYLGTLHTVRAVETTTDTSVAFIYFPMYPQAFSQ
jgi:hypothetical protein